jgi:hypothetical protein
MRAEHAARVTAALPKERAERRTRRSSEAAGPSATDGTLRKPSARGIVTRMGRNRLRVR